MDQRERISSLRPASLGEGVTAAQAREAIVRVGPFPPSACGYPREYSHFRRVLARLFEKGVHSRPLRAMAGRPARHHATRVHSHKCGARSRSPNNPWDNGIT